MRAFKSEESYAKSPLFSRLESLEFGLENYSKVLERLETRLEIVENQAFRDCQLNFELVCGYFRRKRRHEDHSKKKRRSQDKRRSEN